MGYIERDVTPVRFKAQEIPKRKSYPSKIIKGLVMGMNWAMQGKEKVVDAGIFPGDSPQQ